MEIVTRYRAVDGKEFCDQYGCEQWEIWLADLEAANQLLEQGATVWAALSRAHESTKRCRAPYDWAVTCRSYEPALSAITTNTKLVISHWQCRDTPGYSPIRIRPDGDLWVAGDAGSWSGPYGAPVSVRDLIRYVEQNGLVKK